MRLSWKIFDLEMRDPWSIASRQGEGGKGLDVTRTVFVRLQDAQGNIGIGEASPVPYYGESPESMVAIFARLKTGDWEFADWEVIERELEKIDGHYAAKCALNTALLDGAARAGSKPLDQYLNLARAASDLTSSFTIGLAEPEVIERKVRDADAYPLLKLKVGLETDFQNLQALRAAAPTKPLRVDANEAWKTRDVALAKIEALAIDPNILCVEQPMPRSASPEDWIWLRERSPLPLMADESYRQAGDIDQVLGGFDWVNVKLVTAGGPHQAKLALEEARAAGLKTMMGCMIESSWLISAGVRLAALADDLDLDGAALVGNDPFRGAAIPHGILDTESLTHTPGIGAQPTSPGFLETGWHYCG